MYVCASAGCLTRACERSQPRRFLMNQDIITHLSSFDSNPTDAGGREAAGSVGRVALLVLTTCVALVCVPGNAGCGVVLYGANPFSFNKELFDLGTKTTYVALCHPPAWRHAPCMGQVRRCLRVCTLASRPCSEYGPAAFNAMHAPVVTTVDNIQEYWFKKKEMEMADVRGRGSAVLCLWLVGNPLAPSDKHLIAPNRKL